MISKELSGILFFFASCAAIFYIFHNVALSSKTHFVCSAGDNYKFYILNLNQGDGNLNEFNNFEKFEKTHHNTISNLGINNPCKNGYDTAKLYLW
jgi:hypothetical protein